MPTNEYNRNRYHERKAAGLCTRCPNIVEDGHPFCLKCRAIHNKRVLQRAKRYVQNGQCKSCGNPKEQKDKKMCNICNARTNLGSIKRKADRVAKGLCQYCEQPCKTKNCETCLLKMISTNAFGTTTRHNELKELYNKQNGVCPISGRKIYIGDNAELDHIIPRSRGGGNNITNFQWLHVTVNQMKRNLLEEEFFALIEEIHQRINRLKT